MALMMQARPDSNPGAFGLRWNDANGLTVPINGGAVLNGTVWTLVPRASVQLANNDTTYVEVNPGGQIQWQTGQFTSGLGYVSLYTIRVALMVVTSITDWRFGQTSVNGNTAPTYTARQSLTHTQIKALPTTPVEIVPAQGTGKVILPVAGFANNRQVTDYTNVDTNARGYLWYGNNAAQWAAGAGLRASLPIWLGFANVLDGGSPLDVTSWLVCPFISTDNAGDTFAVGTGHSGYQFTRTDNVPLAFVCSNASAGDFTGGDPSNTMTITVLYTVADLTLA